MTSLRRGTRLGKYRLERRLGEGASAQVWLANDTVQGRRVALKAILPSVIDVFGKAAVEHEARVAARLEHPNVTRVLNADWESGYFIIISDPAVRSLEGYRTPRRSPALALQIIRDVSRGLAYAHSHRVLHRDVKPANVLLFDNRTAKLADFGTARFAPAATKLQTEVGTQGYMAPEHAYGRPRFASDVFSLGLTAYELLTGTLPTWPFEWPLEAHNLFESRTPLKVQRVLRKALRVDIEKRWVNAVEFSEAFEAALDSPKAQRRPLARKRSRNAASPFEHEARWFKKSFGAELQLAFACHACEGPIAEAMVVCPWCGTDRNSFCDLTTYPLLCPDCERGVRPEWEACPWCYPGRFEANGRKPPHDPRAERKCRRRGCEGQIRRFMRYCPQCKTKVSRPWSVEGLAPCTRCRWPTTDRWRFCPWCERRQPNSLRL